MSVAIMGAGLSGLACAITLEKQGITPTIFEKRSSVGDRFINGEVTFSLLNRPIKDEIKFLKDKFDISLMPTAMMQNLVMHTKNEVGSLNGDMGYMNVRGRHENSYENQLKKQIKSEIVFNSRFEYEQLCKEFEYVVLATGDGGYATKLGNYRCDFTVAIKGSTVTGNFKKNNADVWFNYDIIPKGYAWLIPFSEKEANLVLAYPEYPSNIKLNINEMWNKFYDLACNDLNQNLIITDSFEISKYMIGICDKVVLDNTYFVGNCFGAISPGVGFGQITSILSGIYSAYDICKLGKYEELSKPLFNNYRHSLTLRRFLESLNNENLDVFARSLDAKFLDGLINKVISNESNIDFLEILTPTLKIWNNLKS
ncbi:MAG: dehydrogenase [Bacillales bacterium]|jgi:flavin-dependent dehydrogenase|nr:dehydrogenase [Bacillales bacterium]